MENSNLYTETVTLYGPDTDMFGKWRPSSLLRLMQETAGRHCEQLGVGFQETLDAGLLWAVTKTVYHLEKTPVLYDTVRVDTWSGKVNRLFCPRHHLFYAGDGSLFGYASSQWILLDAAKRSMAAPSGLPAPLPSDDREPPVALPKHIQMTGDRVGEDIRTVRFTECDNNRHLNNTRYADWFCDMIPERLETSYISDLAVNFKAELTLGQSCALELFDAGDLLMRGINGEGKTAFELSAALCPLPASGKPDTY